MSTINTFFHDLQVYDIEGFTKVRVGRHCDGGYVVLDELCHGTTLYSYGIGDDISFEEDYARRYNSFVKCFDHTIEGINAQDPRISWTKRGLGSARNCRIPVQDIDLTDRTERVLKVDVEHHEWEWLSRWGPEGGWSQIIIELHILTASTERPSVPYIREDRIAVTGPLSPYFASMYADFDLQVNEFIFKEYSRALCRLLQNYVVYHVHGNNSLPKTTLYGYSWPPLLELSLVRRDLVAGRVKPTTQKFPVPGLDFPNKHNRPDFDSVYPFKL